jgi:hypothetical protein
MRVPACELDNRKDPSQRTHVSVSGFKHHNTQADDTIMFGTSTQQYVFDAQLQLHIMTIYF